MASIAASPVYELPLSPTNVIVGVPFVGRFIFPDFHTFPWLPVIDQTDTPSTKTDSLPMLLPYMWYLNSSCMGIDNTSGGDESFAFCPLTRGLEVSMYRYLFPSAALLGPVLLEGVRPACLIQSN